MEIRYKWENLRKNKCPKCGKGLWPGVEGSLMLMCSNRSCDFKITERRMGELSISMNKEALERPTYQGEGEEDLQK